MLSKLGEFSNIEDIYIHLHKNPELSYKEINTTNFINDYLENINNLYKKDEIKIHKLNPTGLIAVIDKGCVDTIAFRADIDALPIKEENNFKYVSQNENVMHACGHDGHMAMLLKFISNIFENNLSFNKNLMFIFQPAEEVDGGARIVLENEIFKSYNLENIFGMHLWPELTSGKIGLKEGVLMGTNLVFEIVIKGKSAHVCTPQNGIDTTQVLSELIQNINYLIAKLKNPFDPIVINIGKIEGGSAPNIIIDKLTLNGTIRAANNNTLNMVHQKLLLILKSLELKYECTISFVQKEITYPTVYNNESLINEVENLLIKNNKEYEILKYPTLACEDFGFYSQEYKTAFFFLGTNAKEHPNMLHTKNFNFDINILNKGVKLYELLLKQFGK